MFLHRNDFHRSDIRRKRTMKFSILLHSKSRSFIFLASQSNSTFSYLELPTVESVPHYLHSILSPQPRAFLNSGYRPKNPCILLKGIYWPPRHDLHDRGLTLSLCFNTSILNLSLILAQKEHYLYA
jgi:hypothetical protein